MRRLIFFVLCEREERDISDNVSTMRKSLHKIDYVLLSDIRPIYRCHEQ